MRRRAQPSPPRQMTVRFEEDPPKVTLRVFCWLKGTSIPPGINPQLDHRVSSESTRKFRPEVPAPPGIWPLGVASYGWPVPVAAPPG
jgi:hypothetical protein